MNPVKSENHFICSVQKNISKIYRFILLNILTSYSHCFVPRVRLMNNKAIRISRSGDRASWYILITKPNKCTIFSNLFLE